MPPANEYRVLDYNVKEDRALLEAAADELRQRRDLDTRSQAYYDGVHPRPLKLVQGKIDNNVIINLAGQVVDTAAHFLTSNQMPDVETDQDTQDETPEEKYIREMWEYNGGAVFLVQQVTDGARCGHNYVKVIPPDEKHPYPRFVSLAPSNTLVFWREDDRSVVLWYSTYWTARGIEYREDVVNRAELDGMPGWDIYEFQKGNNERQWVLRRDIPNNPVTWDYPLSPIYDWPHLPNGRRYYGRSEFGNNLELLSLNDAINKAASDYKAITRVHAAPRTVATGVRADEMNAVSGVDNFWAIPEKEAKVYNVEMQSDLSALLNFITFSQGVFYSISRTAVLSGGPDAFRNVTNLGIKAAFMGQVGKNGILEHLYGKAIAELSLRGLMLADFNIQDIKPKVTFHTALPVSDLEVAQISQMRIDMGIESKETAATENGLDWDVETERLANEGDTAQTALDRQMARTPFPFDTPQDAARRSMQVGSGDMMRGGNNGNA